MKAKTTETELWIKAKDFANELTSHNVIEKGLITKNQIFQERTKNIKAVRSVLVRRGIKPDAF